MTKAAYYLVGSVALSGLAMTSASSQMSDDPNRTAEICSSVYRTAVNSVSYDAQAAVAISTVHREACSERNRRSLEAGFDSRSRALIEGVPLVSSILGNLNISSNRKFCEAFDRGDFTNYSALSYQREPASKALEQFNKCMDIAASSNVILTHEINSPGSVVVSGRMTSQNVTAQLAATTTGGFTCQATADQGQPDNMGLVQITRTKPFTIVCTRSGEVQDGDLSFERPGSIAITTGEGGIYRIDVEPDTIYGAVSRERAEEVARELRSQLASATIRLSELEGRSVRPVRFFFGQNGGDPVTGPRLGCEDWSYKPQSHWEPIATARVCPGGKLEKITRVGRRSGGSCGFNFYGALCVENSQPDP